MNELVRVSEEQIGEKTVHTVDARELHEFLKSQTRYNDWFRSRVEKYGFIEDVDFIAVTEKKVTAQGNKAEFITHHVSIDMAKAISMVENNEMGQAARRYFIDVESKYKVILTDLDKSIKSASIFINLVRPCESAKVMIAHSVCKKHGLPTEFLPAYAEEEKTFSLSDLLKKFKVGMSAQVMNRKLVEKGILEHCKRKSAKGEKAFLSITEEGAPFVKNLVCPQNPRETQPHWYEDKFTDLLKMVS
jgi:phage anti-repressor protein